MFLGANFENWFAHIHHWQVCIIIIEFFIIIIIIIGCHWEWVLLHSGCWIACRQLESRMTGQTGNLLTLDLFFTTLRPRWEGGGGSLMAQMPSLCQAHTHMSSLSQWEDTTQIPVAIVTSSWAPQIPSAATILRVMNTTTTLILLPSLRVTLCMHT